MPQLERYDFRVELNPMVMTLLLISIKYDIDVEYLMNIYDEMKSDTMFFFYMMAGQKVNFPPFPTLEKFSDMGHEISENPKKDFSSYDENVQLIMAEIYDPVTNEIVIEANVTNEKFARIFKQNKNARLSIRKSRKVNEPSDEENNEDGSQQASD